MIFDVFYYDLHSNFYDIFVFKSENKNHRGPGKLPKFLKSIKMALNWKQRTGRGPRKHRQMRN